MIGLLILLFVGLTAGALLLVLRAPPVAFAGLAAAVVSVLAARVLSFAVSLAVPWPPSWLSVVLWALSAEPVRAYFAFRAREELSPRSWLFFALGNALFYVPSFVFGFLAQLWSGDLWANVGAVIALLLLQMTLSVLMCRLISLRWPWLLAAMTGTVASLLLNLLLTYWPPMPGIEAALQAWLLAVVMGGALSAVSWPMTSAPERANEGG